MGYYTYYSLSVENEVPHEEVVKAARALAGITDFIEPEKVSDAWNPFDFISYDSMKWYDWEEDMHKLAHLFPDIVFCLWGEGEERDDNWRFYIKGDEAVLQHGVIVFDPRPEWSY